MTGATSAWRGCSVTHARRAAVLQPRAALPPYLDAPKAAVYPIPVPAVRTSPLRLGTRLLLAIRELILPPLR